MISPLLPLPGLLLLSPAATALAGRGTPAAAVALSVDSGPPRVLPEVPPAHLDRVSRLVSAALGDGSSSGASSSSLEGRDRYAAARAAVSSFQHDFTESDGISSGAHHQPTTLPAHELVYGELSLPVLATILDAVGVQEDEVFLDIGSGDGALVLGASLLYASSQDDVFAEEGRDVEERGRRRRRNAIRKSYGVDIVPGLVDRSQRHAVNLEALLQGADGDVELDDCDVSALRRNQAEVEFFLGDVHAPTEGVRRVLEEATLAVCFATTWSAGNARAGNTKAMSTSLQGRRLPRLSAALSAAMSAGCRIVIVDGRLDEADGFAWEGDLRVLCPDTAPHSVAALYVKT